MLRLPGRALPGPQARSALPQTWRAELGAVTWPHCRGKFTLGFGRTQLRLHNTKQSVQTPYDAIDTVAVRLRRRVAAWAAHAGCGPGRRGCTQIIDNVPKDTKGRVLLCIHLAAGRAARHGKQPLQTVVVQACARLPCRLLQGDRA